LDGCAQRLIFLQLTQATEIEDGIAKSRREGATYKSADLTAWLEIVVHLYPQKMPALPMNLSVPADPVRLRPRGSCTGDYQ
jgi:hypothetical protein